MILNGSGVTFVRLQLMHMATNTASRPGFKRRIGADVNVTSPQPSKGPHATVAENCIVFGGHLGQSFSMALSLLLFPIAVIVV